MFTLIKNSWGFLIFFVSFSSNSGRHNSATKDFSSARDKRIELLFYEESFVTLHSHHAIMAIYSGGSRGRVPPPPSELTLFWDWNSYIDRTVCHFLTGQGIITCNRDWRWQQCYYTCQLFLSLANAWDFHLVMTGFPMIFRRLPNLTENVRRCSDNF